MCAKEASLGGGKDTLSVQKPQLVEVCVCGGGGGGPYFQKSSVVIGECILGFVKIVYSLYILRK